MKKKILFGITALTFVLFPMVVGAQAPKYLGGFMLGVNISEFQDMIQAETALPIRYAEYLTEVEIKNKPGFKSGLISYGNCAVPGRILRIKLKYADSSKKFYEALLKQFKTRFGEPQEWRGDPFHILIAWKWSFKDGQNNKISMILQHNTKDEEEKVGNAVKITVTSFIDQERECFEKNDPVSKQQGTIPVKKKKAGPVDWDPLLPR